jgi:hypothetical protein
VASTQANTWPPLLSGGSQDELLQTQLYGKEVIASVLFEAAPDDEFFFPVDGVLSGFAFDGKLYQNGAEVPAVDPASWFSEEPGAYRGTRPQFPQRGLVLVTDAGLSIIDLESRYAMWMVALRGDGFGLTHNFLDNISGFTPTGVSYQNGRVVITLSPDAGSVFTAPVFIVFDFTLDNTYMERPAYRPPVVGPYLVTPAVYRTGSPITPNTCTTDLVTGGKPTFWWSYPPLPAGLVLDTETGTVTGIPTEVVPQRAYQIVAYNPGGSGETMLLLSTYDSVETITSFTAELATPTAWLDTQLADGHSPEDIFVIESDEPAPVITSFTLTGITRQPGVDWAGRPICQIDVAWDITGPDDVGVSSAVWVQPTWPGSNATPYGMNFLYPSGCVLSRTWSLDVGSFADTSVDNQTFTLVVIATTANGRPAVAELVVNYVLPPAP